MFDYRPGKYGVAKPLYFPFQASTWCGGNKSSKVEEVTLYNHETFGTLYNHKTCRTLYKHETFGTLYNPKTFRTLFNTQNLWNFI